jgi:hypothetical protein
VFYRIIHQPRVHIHGIEDRKLGFRAHEKIYYGHKDDGEKEQKQQGGFRFLEKLN